MPRPPRPPGSERKDIWFLPNQLESLDALIETSTLGRPSFTSLVLQAVDALIEQEMAKPEENVETGVAKLVDRRDKQPGLQFLFQEGARSRLDDLAAMLCMSKRLFNAD